MGGTPWLLSFQPGVGTPEARVPNEVVLSFFARHGAYIRLMATYNSWCVVRTPGTSDLARFVALVGFWEQAGMLYESAVSLVVGLVALQSFPAVSLADSQRVVFVRRDNKSPPQGQSYVEWTSSRIAQECAKAAAGNPTKPVAVNPSTFVADLMALDGAGFLQSVGIPWKEKPSKRLVPAEERKNWKVLPVVARGLVDALGAPSRDLLESTYNKLKHGPQFVVMDPYEVARMKNVEQLVGSLREFGPTLRVLLDGARTEPQNLTERVAPFILPDPYVLGRVCKETLLPIAVGVSVLAEWHYRSAFRRTPPGSDMSKDTAWLAMTEDLYRSEFQ